MAAADVAAPPAPPAPAVPDYLASPNAVFDDKDVQWRYGTPPDYSKTRAEWERTKSMNHEAGSLPQLVENLVKNWEVEASFKPRLQDWRTIDHANYSFAINGGEPQTAEHMLKVGTYNAIVAPNDFYSPKFSDFAQSHKTFKRMMPTFAWEVLEVYSGPPKVAFRWRHWGEMKNDYVSLNDKGEKITVKAHGGKIDIQGVTVATVDDKVRLQSVQTWFDPLEMFRQIAPGGVVNRAIVDEKVTTEPPKNNIAHDGIKIAEEHNHASASGHQHDQAPRSVVAPEISPSTSLPADAYVPHQGTSSDKAPAMPGVVAGSIVDTALSQGTSMPVDRSHAQTGSPDDSGHVSDGSDKTWEKIDAPETSSIDAPESTQAAAASADHTESNASRMEPQTVQMQEMRHTSATTLAGIGTGTVPYDTSMEKAVGPAPGEAVVAPAGSEETRITAEELSQITPAQCPFLMNRE